MRLHINKGTAITFCAAVFLFFIDRLLKVFLAGIDGGSIEIVRGIFFLELKKNPNIAFSLPLSGPILLVLIFLMIFFLIAWWISLIKQKTAEKACDPAIYPLTFLILGASINLFDRFKEGGVLDYFYLRYFTVFNVADMMISGAVIALLIIFFCRERAEKKKKAARTKL